MRNKFHGSVTYSKFCVEKNISTFQFQNGFEFSKRASNAKQQFAKSIQHLKSSNRDFCNGYITFFSATRERGFKTSKHVLKLMIS